MQSLARFAADVPQEMLACRAAKRSIPARADVDVSALDNRAQATSPALTAADAAGGAMPTFAGTHAAGAGIVGVATDAIAGFFYSDKVPADGATAVAEATGAAG